MAHLSEVKTEEIYLPFTNFQSDRPQAFSSRVQVDFGAVSDKGKVRPNNEDAFLIMRTGRYMQKLVTNIDPELIAERQEECAYAMAVADGMGGLAAGEVASSMAITTIVNLMLSSVKWALKLDHREFREREIQEGIERAVDYLGKADFAVGRKAKEDQKFERMGTTLTVSYSFGDDLFIFHVGDSRAYRFHDGRLDRVTRDHTLAQAMADMGDLSQEAADKHKFRHLLTRAIGHHGGKVDVEIHHLKLTDNDQVLLCSDGLTDLVSDQQISQILGGKGSSQNKCEGLVNLALNNGGKDNITVVLGHYHIPS
jgi:serine/threonine protein phosphatase PrpC